MLSVPELCYHVAEVWVSGTIFIRNLLLFKKQNPGKVRLFPFSLSFLALSSVHAKLKQPFYYLPSFKKEKTMVFV